MSFSRGVVRGRIEAGVPRARPLGAAWELEELELPVSAFIAETAHATVDELESARRQAELEASIEAARAERQAAEHARELRDAYARGVSEGRAAGAAEASARLADVIAALDDATEQLREQESRYLHGIEEHLAALAVTVARHVVGREVRQDPMVVAELVRRALTEFPLDQSVRVRVHPLDLTAITAAVDAEGAPLEVAPNRDISWLADPRLQRGGAMLEGRERVVDGRVDVALERAFRRLSGTHA